MAKIGFTGSRFGPTSDQAEMLKFWIGSVEEVHHGDCVGADATADAIAASYGTRRVAHPPVRAEFRAWCQTEETRPERPYLTRNHDIVDETDFLVATPSGPEHLRSGTWATIRYARKKDKSVVIIWPDGTCEGRWDREGESSDEG